jgi:hypothetical protein
MNEVTRRTALPADALWPVISQVRDWWEWLPTVDAVRPVDPDRPEEVGASYVVEQPGLPTATWTITEWEPGRSFTWESRRPGILSTGRHVLEPLDDADEPGTTVRLSVEWTGPLAPLVRLLYGRVSRDYVTREAEALEATTARRAGA